jgi:hypothetical protein
MPRDGGVVGGPRPGGPALELIEVMRRRASTVESCGRQWAAISPRRGAAPLRARAVDYSNVYSKIWRDLAQRKLPITHAAGVQPAPPEGAQPPSRPAGPPEASISLACDRVKRRVYIQSVARVRTP